MNEKYLSHYCFPFLQSPHEIENDNIYIYNESNYDERTEGENVE